MVPAVGLLNLTIPKSINLCLAENYKTRLPPVGASLLAKGTCSGKLAGFATLVQADIVVTVGQSLRLVPVMKPSGIAETVSSDLKNIHGLTLIGRARVFDALRNLTSGAHLDEHQFAKQPDWTYDAEYSGKWPADRLDEHRAPEEL